jgi:Peptidase propeptide and YPEB domain.
MNMNKISIKFFVILILSLTLTAGYAQALPSLYDFKSQSASTPSVQDLISSALSRMFGNSHTWGLSFPIPDTCQSLISEDEAIAIAKNHFHWPAFTQPVTAELVGTVWKVTVHEYHGIAYQCSEGKICPPQPSGYIVKINAVNGEIISVNNYV